MKGAKTIAFAAGTMLLAWHAAIAQDAPGVMALTADETKWSSQGGLALPGMEQTNLIGNPSNPGPYTLRLKFPAGFKLPPHFHPEAREITGLSGVWYTGYGETSDPAKLKALPAGSFYTEPANEPHYVVVREPTVIRVSGIGPSGRKDVATVAPK